MAGLYVHIPFCRSKCAYCDFYSIPSASAAADYVDALITEARLRRNEISGPFTTLYLGGGTPSLLPPVLLDKLLDTLSSIYSPGKPFEEATIEANPEDISAGALTIFRGIGINRVSIGIQSFDDKFLKIIGRSHKAIDSFKALDILSSSGINYNADLIYGLPNQTPGQWTDELATLLRFRPPHLSAYLLSYEPGTRLYVGLQRGIVHETSEHHATEMYARLCGLASDAGYRHYEISNFAQPGYQARHNSLYWQYSPYLGLGVAAHSFDGNIRRFNPANIKRYIRSLSACRERTDAPLPCQIEPENAANRLNDYIITSLRTDMGLDMEFVLSTFGSVLHKRLFENIHSHGNRVLPGLELTGSGKIRIAQQHWLTADTILRELILD